MLTYRPPDIWLTSANYQTANLIGNTFNDPRSLGTVVMKAQPSLTAALLTHELGHVFGASHDAQDFTYIVLLCRLPLRATVAVGASKAKKPSTHSWNGPK